MSKRTEALKRLTLGTVWFVLATIAMGLIWLPVAILCGALDITIQVVTGGNGISEQKSQTVMQALGWYLDGTEWWLAGKDDMNLLPYVGI